MANLIGFLLSSLRGSRVPGPGGRCPLGFLAARPGQASKTAAAAFTLWPRALGGVAQVAPTHEVQPSQPPEKKSGGGKPPMPSFFERRRGGPQGFGDGGAQWVSGRTSYVILSKSNLSPLPVKGASNKQWRRTGGPADLDKLLNLTSFYSKHHPLYRRQNKHREATFLKRRQSQRRV